ncbi:hypothetical protein INT43_008617 [Umbelopsis isabellina]|uniref:SH3 domain-containing protein n=1 Tax=Mortierella isabellina TaxID=91625 RepID=A0A8H7PWJ3_MORIS|nr:hypothetical protein INT43_008617 [Umbelopsis isabellina]
MIDLYKSHHSYEAQREDELSFAEGELFRITNQDDAEWWQGEKAESKETGIEFDLILYGWQFLEKAESAPEAEFVKSHQMLATVVEDYQASGSDELTLWKGGIVTVDDHSDAEWWHGDLNGKKGIFPKANVHVIDSTDEGEEVSKDVEAEDTTAPTRPKSTFRLAAYGVKQGGIGSVLAGGFPMLKKTGRKPEASSNEQANTEKTVSPEKTRPASVSTPESARSPSTEERAVPPRQVQSMTNPVADRPSAPSTAATGSQKAIVINNHSATGEDEIDLTAGEYVKIIDRNIDEGWWQGTNETGRTGLFPSNFVKEVEEEPPLRPRRARPPTVKTAGSPHEESLTSPSMAKPPPVPAGSRPSSLITNRKSVGQDSPYSQISPQTSTKPPIPSVPAPPRRTHSTTEEPRSPMRARPPSVSMRSPDLPQLPPGGHPVRPSRPVPTPKAEIAEFTAEAPKEKDNQSSQVVPEQAVPPTPPARTGRPPLPQAPRPPVPSTTAGKDEQMKGLGVSMRSSVPAKDHDDTPPVQPKRPAPTNEDSGNQKVQTLIDQAIANLRDEFMQALDQEREKVARLMAEVEELRQRLDM